MTEVAKTASEAKKRGLDTYFTGNSCPHGHVAPRWARGKACVVCSPMVRDKGSVERMWTAYKDAGTRTLQTGTVMVPKTEDGGKTWSIVDAV